MRHNPSTRTMAIGVALLALMVANLLPIRTDLAALAAETPAEPGIYAEPSEHTGHAGWHYCADPARLVCTAPHPWLIAAPVMPAVMPLAPEIPAPSLYEETQLPWRQAPPPPRFIALALQARAPPLLG